MTADSVRDHLQIATFLWGCGGSVAVEVINLHAVYQQPTVEIPERYRRLGFYVVRFLLTLLAGCLAVAYDIDKPLLALNVGAATPLIIRALAEGIGPSSSSSVIGSGGRTRRVQNSVPRDRVEQQPQPPITPR